MVYNKRHVDKRLEMGKAQIRDKRKSEYYRSIFSNNDNQFEIKLNGLGAYFIEIYDKIWFKIYKTNKKEDLRYNIRNSIISLISSIADFLVFNNIYYRCCQ